VLVSDASTFCPDAATRRHYDRIVALVRAAGYDATAGDEYLLGAFANAAARLEELAERVAKTRDLDRRLRLLHAERLARTDLARLIDALERHYAGAAIEEAAPELRRTGTGDVLDFPAGGKVRSVVGQRIIAALARTSGLTRNELGARVSGNKQSFLRSLKECIEAGAIRRTGSGARGSPHRYWRA
jgi:hypothetical protein